MPSSVILAMRYEPRTRTLLIVFRGGRGTYRYFNVPPEEWAEFRTSGSKGTYLNEVFKDREYRYEKVPETRAKPLPVREDERRYSNGDDDAARLLQWGETWALPMLDA